MRCLELFAGIGGFAASFPHLYIVNAVDIDQQAATVYRENFFHPYIVAEIASLDSNWFNTQNADVWWMSPPCTPFTRRGRKMGLEDTRSEALRHIIDVATEVMPPIIAMENVVGFERSDAFELIDRKWTSAGYKVDWSICCPSDLGWPNKRPRVYLLATLPPFKRVNRNLDLEISRRPLSKFLDSAFSVTYSGDELFLERAAASQYLSALDRVRADDPNAITACFTSSYGRSITKSGSYLWEGERLRRFSPREVSRLMGFPSSYKFPPSIPLRRVWHLLGNSLSLPAVRHSFKNIFSPESVYEWEISQSME